MTLNVKSLYTNIPHSEGLEACRAALNTRQVLQPPTVDLTHLIELILMKNSFIFEGEHYLQVHGTAMGIHMVPSYFNIFMDDLERRILNQVHKTPAIWWRYIDDMFTISPQGEGCLIEFIEEINGKHPKIQFTAEWCKRSIAFLEVMVTLDEGIPNNRYINKDYRHAWIPSQTKLSSGAL